MNDGRNSTLTSHINSMHDEDHVVHFLVKQFEAEPRIYWNLETFQWKNHKLYQFVNGTTLEKKRRFWILCNAIISTKKFFFAKRYFISSTQFSYEPFMALGAYQSLFFLQGFFIWCILHEVKVIKVKIVHLVMHQKKCLQK